jgi:rfaE bifunctional protein kinase chain/domain
MNIDFERFQTIVQRFKSKKILVLGDLMLDKYIWGDVSRISPEAPVPVVEVKADTSCLGGAGNVSHNLESLGSYPLLVGVIGKDEPGRWIKKNIQDSRGIFIDGKRPTTVKTRIIAQHQQVVRVDWEKKSLISPAIEKQIFDFIQKEHYDGLILSDYNKGTLTKSLMNKVLPSAQQRKIPVFVDPKVENLHLFSSVTLITPNHSEAAKIVGHECHTHSQVEEAGKEILSLIHTLYLIIKRGEQGMTVFERGKKPIHIPTIAKEVFDVTGAGDTVIATASLALLAGATIQEAAIIANTAAGIVVGKIGTATVAAQELLSAFKRINRKSRAT